MAERAPALFAVSARNDCVFIFLLVMVAILFMTLLFRPLFLEFTNINDPDRRVFF
jgi:hypothetical protein